MKRVIEPWENTRLNDYKEEERDARGSMVPSREKRSE
jgi:hypothetical protein